MQVIIGYISVNGIKMKIHDIILYEKNGNYVTEKGYVVLKENVIEIREEK